MTEDDDDLSELFLSMLGLDSCRAHILLDLKRVSRQEAEVPVVDEEN